MLQLEHIPRRLCDLNNTKRDTFQQVYVVCHTKKSQTRRINKSKSFEQIYD